MKDFPEHTIYATNPNVRYVPFIKDGIVGYRAHNEAGNKEMFVYLVPSGDPDDGTPNVFLYAGTEGEPHFDTALSHVPLPELEGTTRLYAAIDIPDSKAMEHEICLKLANEIQALVLDKISDSNVQVSWNKKGFEGES